MSSGARTTLVLLLLALLAGGVLLWLNARSARTPAQDDLLDLFEDDTPKDAGAADRPVASTPAAEVGTPRGVPRILPPDAAIEDVRDAQALEDIGARRAALAAAYASIGRIAQTERILGGLQRYALDVEDARVRGATYAALGANTSGPSRAWLVERLREERDDVARLGALLGLAYAKAQDARDATALGDLPHRTGALPARVDVRDALPAIVARLDGTVGRDALVVLRASLGAHDGWYDALKPAVAALEKRVGRD